MKQSIKVKTDELQQAIKDAEATEKDRTYFYFVQSLSVARATLSDLVNPLKNPIVEPHEYTEKELSRVIWHLKNSMVNKI